MTMHAITIKQPWAEAISRHGKDVENRSRRPPAHLIGERVAIHVGLAADEWRAAWVAGITNLAEQSTHLIPLVDWVIDPREEKPYTGPVGRCDHVPNAGHIIATARLVGWVLKLPDGLDCGGETGWTVGDALDALRSPWFTGPIGWVLADVRPLAVPVGADPCVVCDAQFADPTGRYGHASNCRGYGEKAIPGKLYPFALSPEVEAAVLQQEVGSV